MTQIIRVKLLGNIHHMDEDREFLIGPVSEDGEEVVEDGVLFGDEPDFDEEDEDTDEPLFDGE